MDAVTLPCACWDGGKAEGEASENYLGRVQKMQNSGNKMSDLGIVNRRRSAYTAACAFRRSVVGVNVRGEKCSSPMLCINRIYQAERSGRHEI